MDLWATWFPAVGRRAIGVWNHASKTRGLQAPRETPESSAEKAVTPSCKTCLGSGYVAFEQCGSPVVGCSGPCKDCRRVVSVEFVKAADAAADGLESAIMEHTDNDRIMDAGGWRRLEGQLAAYRAATKEGGNW
jgi:hypothetical protein